MTPVQDPGISPMGTASSEARPWDFARDLEQSEPRRRGLFSAIGASDWIIGLLFVLIDVVSWIAIYGTTTYLRSDNFLVGPFEFFLVDVVQLAVICQAIFMIGGYD